MGTGPSAAGALTPTVLLSPLPTALPDHPIASSRHLRNHPLTKEFVEAGDGTVPLPRAGEFLGLVGQAMNEVIAASPNGRVLKGYRGSLDAAHATGWLTLIRDLETGRERTIDSRNVVLATGASQPVERLRREVVAGVNLVERCGERLLQSGDVVSTAGFAAVAARLAGLGRPPRVAIVGGSTSAAAVAFAMLNRMPGVTFGPGGLTILHRRELRIFYPSVRSGPGRWIYRIWAG